MGAFVLKGVCLDMYLSEKIFIMKFLAGLRKIGIAEIPYDNEEFYDGAENMRQYFQTHRNMLGSHANELAMLFLKKPLGGIFFELKEGIAMQNGGLMSFENPYYISATIKLEEDGADYILNQNNLDVSIESILGFSKAFCDGAGLRYKDTVRA